MGESWSFCLIYNIPECYAQMYKSNCIHKIKEIENALLILFILCGVIVNVCIALV